MSKRIGDSARAIDIVVERTLTFINVECGIDETRIAEGTLFRRGGRRREIGVVRVEGHVFLEFRQYRRFHHMFRRLHRGKGTHSNLKHRSSGTRQHSPRLAATL